MEPSFTEPSLLATPQNDAGGGVNQIISIDMQDISGDPQMQGNQSSETSFTHMLAAESGHDTEAYSTEAVASDIHPWKPLHLQCIWRPSNTAGSIFDIVILHTCLQRDWKQPWTAVNGFCWLSDVNLGEEFKSARIFVVKSPINLSKQQRRNTINIIGEQRWPMRLIGTGMHAPRILGMDEIFDLELLHEVAKDLIERLIHHRKEEGSENPIIFVGLGFGGILAKYVYLESAQRSTETDQGFRQSIKGFVFFGTSHSTDSNSSLMRFLSRKSREQRHDTLNQMDRGGEEENLCSVNQRFKVLGGETLPCVCFYEGSVLEGSRCPVVSYKDATINSDCATQKELDANYSNLAQFTGQNNSNLTVVISSIRALIYQITKSIPREPTTLDMVRTIPPDPGLRLLSLDGGGVRGLFTVIVLQALMEEVREITGNEEPPKPCDFFHLAGGTSTGGLLAIMLFRLKMDIRAARSAYWNMSSEIFDLGWDRLNPAYPVVKYAYSHYDWPWFSGRALEKAVQKVIKENLSHVHSRGEREGFGPEGRVDPPLLHDRPQSLNTRKRGICFVCCLPRGSHRSILLRTYTAKKVLPETPVAGNLETATNVEVSVPESERDVSMIANQESWTRSLQRWWKAIIGQSSTATPASAENATDLEEISSIPTQADTHKYTITQAARATSAAPLYFPPMEIGRFTYFDGGIDSNNPIIKVITEAKVEYGHDAPVAGVVSIGTGVCKPAAFDASGIRNKLTSFVTRATDTEQWHEDFVSDVHGLYENYQCQYFRLQGPRALGSIDLSATEKLNEIEKLAEEYISSREGRQDIRQCAESLLGILDGESAQYQARTAKKRA